LSKDREYQQAKIVETLESKRQ